MGLKNQVTATIDGLDNVGFTGGIRTKQADRFQHCLAVPFHHILGEQAALLRVDVACTEINADLFLDGEEVL